MRQVVQSFSPRYAAKVLTGEWHSASTESKLLRVGLEYGGADLEGEVSRKIAALHDNIYTKQYIISMIDSYETLVLQSLERELEEAGLDVSDRMFRAFRFMIGMGYIWVEGNRVVFGDTGRQDPRYVEGPSHKVVEDFELFVRLVATLHSSIDIGLLTRTIF